MTVGHSLIWMVVLIGGHVTRLIAQEKSCDLSLAYQCNCTFLVSLQAYDISCEGNASERLVTSGNATRPISVNVLDLSSNHISSMPLHFLDGIANISVLDLSNNSLTEIPEAAVQPGLAIVELRLGHNQISIVNVSDFSTYEMRKVDLSHNNVSRLLGEQDKNLTWNVHHLDLSFNHLENLKEAQLHYLREVHSIDLTHNSIKLTDIFPTMSVKHLNLSYNALPNLPDGLFKHLTSLQELVLSNNEFTNFQSRWFIGLQKLVVLNLYNNNISSLDANMLQYLPSLHTLDLSFNSIAMLGSHELAWENPRLKTLNLSHNKLTNMDKYSFSKLNHLTSLILTGNHKMSVSYGTKLPQHLVYLDLSDCAVTELFECDFKSLIDLKYLHLQGNNLSCDCHMTWLVTWCKLYMDADLRLLTEEKQPWMCKTNNSLTPFSTFPLDDFVCKTPDHAKQFCAPVKPRATSEYLTTSPNSTFLPLEDIDLQMNTSANGDNIVSKWSVNDAYPIYGFKFKFTGSEEGLKTSPWIHQTQREYIMTDIVSYTHYNVCVTAYHNKTFELKTSCDSVYIISSKVYVGIMAGMVAIVPCFIALIIVIWKDRKAPKYEQLYQQQLEVEEKEAGSRHGLILPVASHSPVDSNSQNLPRHGESTTTKTAEVINSKENESHINQSFSVTDELAEAGQKASVTMATAGTPNTSDNTSLPPQLQFCDEDHDINYSTKL